MALPATMALPPCALFANDVRDRLAKDDGRVRCDSLEDLLSPRPGHFPLQDLLNI